MTDSEKINFLGGQVNALLAFTSAVIKAHHDAARLEAAFAESRDLQEAITLPTNASEAFIKGQEDIRASIKGCFLSAALRRGA
jgi:hypothetical protein